MEAESPPLFLPPAATRDGNLRCPHCTWPGQRRTSEEVTILMRGLHFRCTNDFCGHTWHATLQYDYGIVPSAIPNPAMAELPLRTPRREDVMAAVRRARFCAEGSEDDLNQMDLFDRYAATL